MTRFIISFLCICLVILVSLSIYLLKEKRAKGPPKDYWFWRSDGNGKQYYRPSSDVYLKQTINNPKSLGKCSSTNPCKFPGICRDGECVDHCNSEIYNNPCCKGEFDCESLDKNGDDYIMSKLNKSLCQSFQAMCSVNGDIAGNYSGWNNSGKCNLIKTTIPVDVPWDLTQFVRDTYLNNPYLYNKVKITLKGTNVKNGFGSRGWGFWTTYYPWQFIWFMNNNGLDKDGNPYKYNGLYASILSIKDDKAYVSGKRLPDLDESYHDYEIKWKKDKITFLVDNKIVLEETRSEYIPSVNMSFHCWIDNVVYDTDDKGNTVMLYHSFKGEQSQEVKSLEFK